MMTIMIHDNVMTYVIVYTTDDVKYILHICIRTDIFLDLEKASDTIDHTLLLYNLNKLGFRGYVWKLLKSYLTNYINV